MKDKALGVWFRLLTLAALALVAGAYCSPIWWVSLKAPQFPPDSFPDGVRIHFHFTGVMNGCQARESKEVIEEEPLDCVQEMNTINHFIGMLPMEEGAKLEFKIAPYVVGAFCLLLLAFMAYRGPVWWLLPLGGIGLPVGFLGDFAYWMWWFGHNLQPWGAFTVKPFMPTIFGEGKVAQFSTFAYPHYGFGMMALASVLLLLAVLLRRKQLRLLSKRAKP